MRVAGFDLPPLLHLSFEALKRQAEDLLEIRRAERSRRQRAHEAEQVENRARIQLQTSSHEVGSSGRTRRGLVLAFGACFLLSCGAL
jgi:hypothetical protein